jgi:aspartyl-tRNA(Asn)/glutamyl-tRNA(Gln) amidotransferase subunit C
VPLTTDDIRKLADLARLEITPGEVADVSAKLTAIVGLVDELSSVSTTGVSPMAHPLDQKQRLRADVVTERDEHERYQRNAPAVEQGLYLVPKVIE